MKLFVVYANLSKNDEILKHWTSPRFSLTLILEGFRHLISLFEPVEIYDHLDVSSIKVSIVNIILHKHSGQTFEKKNSTRHLHRSKGQKETLENNTIPMYELKGDDEIIAKSYMEEARKIALLATCERSKC